MQGKQSSGSAYLGELLLLHRCGLPFPQQHPATFDIW